MIVQSPEMGKMPEGRRREAAGTKICQFLHMVVMPAESNPSARFTRRWSVLLWNFMLVTMCAVVCDPTPYQTHRNLRPAGPG